MSILKSKKGKDFIAKLPNPKLLTILAIALILGLAIYLILILSTLN